MNKILAGYLITYSYLLSAFLLALLFRRIIKKQNEISRKIIHIMAGFGWIILRVYFEGTIHTIIVTGSFVLLTVFSTFIVPDKFDYMERKEGGHGTFIFTSTMFIMALISFFVPSFFVPFGVGIVSLSCGDGMAAVIGSNIKKYNPKIIGQKSLWGSVSCVFFTILSISVLSLVFGIGLSFLEILILGIIVGVLEMISGKYDNISIPFCVMGLSYIFLR